MSDAIKKSPWGKVQFCEELYPGVYDVSTARHGGIMVRLDVADKILSAEAKKCGFKQSGYLNFEEDTQAAVVERELMDKGLWEGSPRFENKADYEELINESLQQWNPAYWKARETAIGNAGEHIKPEKSDKPSILGQAKENQELIKNQGSGSTPTKKDETEL